MKNEKKMNIRKDIYEYDLTIKSYSDRILLGRNAAQDIAKALRQRLAQQSEVRIIFAAAPSQQETLDELRRIEGIDWKRVSAFHMDEYIGLSAEAPQRFGNWLTHVFFRHLSLKEVNLIEPEKGVAACIDAYSKKLSAAPIDFVIMGIGVNGHLAFNDPPVADLADPCSVKEVKLDALCRQQQVDDKCFTRLHDVPQFAVTLTIPRLLDAAELFCLVPGAAKREAVRRTLTEEASSACPATALRRHPRCSLYLDEQSLPEGLYSGSEAQCF
ncbi:6-phosphogluconolactonase [Phytobacter sp. V91]|uniref:6-phosphogluconolactonase n=1 Tax=Phytobacter sp. V91 TaxID=3369425 RepID=UPI003F5DAA51